MDIVSNFASNLKNLRLNNNLTQQELGNKLNISKQVISNYENNKRIPDLYTIIKISNFFNCSIDSLIYSNTIIDIDKLISLNNSVDINSIDDLLKELNRLNDISSKIINLLNTSKKNNLIEFSKELSTFEQNKIAKIEYLNSIDIDFYENNNIKIFNSPVYSFHENFDTLKIPNIAPISAGYPSFTCDEVDKYFNIKKEDLLHDIDKYFILKIDGDSMNKMYKNDDYILVEKTPFVENNTPAIVVIENDFATFKIFSKDKSNVYLSPCSTNPCHKKQTYPLSKYKYRIIGKVLGVINEYE